MWENPAPAEKDDRLDQDEGLGVKLPLAERLGAAPAELQVVVIGVEKRNSTLVRKASAGRVIPSSISSLNSKG